MLALFTKGFTLRWLLSHYRVHLRPMATQQKVTSFSMPEPLYRALSRRLPRHGDRSRLLTRLVEMYLTGEVVPSGVSLQPHFSVAQSNTNSTSWQQP